MTKDPVDVLGSLPFLDGAAPEVIARLAARAVERRFAEGETVYREGGAGTDMCIVVEGLVEIVKGDGQAATVLATRGPGNLLGEMAFIDGSPRFATVRALAPSRVLEFSADAIHEALSLQPMLLSRIMRVLVSRLRESHIQMIDDLARKNDQLLAAYDTTLEGWSRALDLRDNETEGHCRRVTEMTIRFAERAGMAGGEIVHVRRGALLHDIGKMGIPDAILRKPGPLSEEEWTVMRRHPELARRLLEPIAFLRPALDIPYCHHERWDGAGYPRGLRGDAIPFAARLFAAADVWDAMVSDRPYRKGLPPDRVRDHIRSLGGTHLDPRVVEIFISD